MGCLYTKIFINNNEYEMLVDSGAEICTISEEYYNKIVKDNPKIPIIPLTGLT